MGKIGDQEITNLTEWILVSTEFRPTHPETCVVRDELGNQEKLWVILLIWAFLVVLCILYCCCCEQRLFPRQQLFSRSTVDQTTGLLSGSCPNMECNLRNRLTGTEEDGAVKLPLFLSAGKWRKLH